jgi:hypothetical protein
LLAAAQQDVEFVQVSSTCVVVDPAAFVSFFAVSCHDLLATLTWQAAEKLDGENEPADRLQQLKARVAELEVHACELEGQHSKEHTMFFADSFGMGLMYYPAELQKVNSAMALDLKTCTTANEELHKIREAVESLLATTKGKLRLERQARKGMV